MKRTACTLLPLRSYDAKFDQHPECSSRETHSSGIFPSRNRKMAVSANCCTPFFPFCSVGQKVILVYRACSSMSAGARASKSRSATARPHPSAAAAGGDDGFDHLHVADSVFQRDGYRRIVQNRFGEAISLDRVLVTHL